MKDTIYIALLGSGTVGSGVSEVLKMNARELAERVGKNIVLKKVLVRDIKKPRKNIDMSLLTDDFESIVNDKDIDIVVEVMGGLHPAKEYMLRAIEAGKSIVTANKDVLATYGKDVLGAAERAGVDFQFEASVGGGIPIITSLKQSLTANKITEVMGIVNGTTNYMLTKMANDGVSYETVLKEAQEKGYAEADPTADVEGLDAARKAAILASIAFNTRVHFNDVSVEGITKITTEDIDYAKDLGFVIKLLAIGKDSAEKGVDVRVHPVFLPKEHPLASVNGVYNAIFVRGNAIGDTMFYGQGAGSLPTASAVVADIVEVARNMVHHNLGKLLCTCYEHKELCPIEEVESCYYIRLLVDDKPGVLGAIATEFGRADVSLRSVIQTRRNIAEHAEIVAVTHCVKHVRVRKALEALRKLPVVDEVRNVIRVESE